MEAEWGKDAVRDFVFEYRSFLGRDVAVALRRAFEIQPDDFDLKFRRYLRRKYLPLLAAKGEASEYGERFRVGALRARVLRDRRGAVPVGRFRRDAHDVQGRRRHRAPVRPRPQALQEPLGRPHDEVRIHRRPVPHDGPRERAGPLLRAGRRPHRRLRPAGARPQAPHLLGARRRPPRAHLAWRPTCRSRRRGRRTESPSCSRGIEGNSRDIFLLDLKWAVRNLTNDPEYDEAPVFSPDGKFIYHRRSSPASRRSSVSRSTTPRRPSR